MNANTFTETNDTLRVIIGTGASQAEYFLHKTVLRARCPYFEGLLSFNGTEVTENTATLPDVNVDAFKVFLAFIYINTYCLSVTADKNSWPGKFLLNLKVYVLADRLLMLDLKRKAYDHANSIREKIFPNWVYKQAAKYVYENTPNQYSDSAHEETTATTTSEPNDKMRDLVSKMCCNNLDNLMDDSDFTAVFRSHGELAQDILLFKMSDEGNYLSKH